VTPLQHTGVKYREEQETRKEETMKRIISILFALALVLAFSLVATVPVAAATRNVPGTYATIQAAIDAANPGDTIVVAAGTYAGNINVNKSSLTIVGDPGDSSPGPGVNAPIIDGGGAVADAFDLANGVSNVTISGFEIRNFAATDFTNGTGVGVQAWVPSTSNITVSDNWFHDVGYGVMVGNDGSSAKYALGTHRNWAVSGNIIENFFSIGVELTDTSNSSVQGNVIHMPGVGVNGQIGIFSWAHISQSGLTVTENTIDGTMVAFPAVYMYAWNDVAPTPNLNDVTIGNNTISTIGSPFQVYLRDIGTGTVTGVHVNYNSLTGLNGLKNLTAVSIDGTKNWWGANDGPSGVGPGSGAAVSANVLFLPWACKPTTGGLAYLTPSAGMIDDLAPVSTPPNPPATFPYGMFTFKITGLSAGEEVTLTIELPGPTPVGTKWWKYHNNTWSPMDIGSDNGDNIITVTLKDGRTPDDEDLISGQITDQGGPGGGAVGWETYPVSKARVLLPWVALLVAIASGVSLLVLRRRRTQT
jgi:hypothetical protein